MEYTEVKIAVTDAEQRERIIAQLDDDNITGFEETEDALLIYFKERANTILLDELVSEANLSYSTKTIAEQNWNESWESNFQPVLIDDYCYIRAAFHPEKKDVEHEIIITPKMSFGTGHHATTLQMVKLMRDMDFNGKSVFDFGTGTGILAILAHKLGAAAVFGIDNDEWAYKNAVENCENNEAASIRIAQATIEDLKEEEQYEIILANINRHILLDTMASMYRHLKQGGTLLLSGILENEDIDIIRQSAEQNGFTFTKMTAHDKWAAMQFGK